MNKKIKVFEVFAGIGSQFKALKNIEKSLDIEVESLGLIEWYLDAIISYQKIHLYKSKKVNVSRELMLSQLQFLTLSKDSKSPVSKNYFMKQNEEKLNNYYQYLLPFINTITNPNQDKKFYTDINKVQIIPKDIDIFTYSFPCQDLSQQGNQLGIQNNTRSGLLLQVKRILKQNQDRLPKTLLMENVKSLTNKKFMSQFEDWIKFLETLGYNSSWKVLNSTDFGSSQNRERVFMVSKLNNKPFKWPLKIKHNNDLSRILESNFQPTAQILELTSKIKEKGITEFKTTTNNISKAFIKNWSNFNSENYIYNNKGFGPTLTASGANSRLKFYFKNKDIFRYINAYESFKYMGFSSKDVDKILETNLVSENKIIFMAGNSISVEVLEYIFKNLILEIKEEF